MEFPDLGKQCTWPSCRVLDFLPLTCGYCKYIFCKDHFNQNAHGCELFNRDINNQTDVRSFICASEGCTTCSPIEMLCPKCQKHFCLLHRCHDCFDFFENIEEKLQTWNRPKEQFTKSIKIVNNTIDDKLKKAVQIPKKQETALKIQLMRLKGKAEGCSAIPTIDRIYLLIILPKNLKKSPKAVYVSKNWSVGKVIDSVSGICKVLNKNNELRAPKLRLFKITNGCQISCDMSSKIADIINQNQIINGETLILEYVDPDKDLNKYELKNFVQYNDFL